MRAFVDDYGSAEPIADWCFDEEVDFSSLQQTRASTGEAPEGFRCGYDALDLDSGSGARELSAHGAIVPWVGPANYYARLSVVRSDRLRQGGCKEIMSTRIGVLLFVISLLAGACSSGASPELGLLLDSPMADVSLTFAEPSSVEEIDFSPLTNISNRQGPLDPEVRILFESISPDLVEQGRDELIEQATAAGFAPVEVEGQRGYVAEGDRYELWYSTNDDSTIGLYIELREDALTVFLL